jgi:hypothetical protein
MAYVFISHSHSQARQALRTAIDIQQYGHEVFLDQDDLPAGEPFGPKIKFEIKKSDIFVFLISPESVKPGCFALTELSIARQKWGTGSNRILPVQLEQTPMESIPEFLQAITFLTPLGNFAAEIASAVDEISQTIEKVEAPQAVTAAPLQSSKAPPEFLAFMVDRDSQNVEISRTLPSPQAEHTERFIAYLVPGKANDLHKSIAERYVNHTLPDHLKRHDETFANDHKTVSWPAADSSVDRTLGRLLRSILKAYSLPNTGRMDDVEAHFSECFNTFLPSHTNPLTICVNVDADKWDGDSAKVFALLAGCLAKLRLSHNVIMTAFFFFKFPEPKGGLLSMFSRAKASPAEKFVEDVGQGRFDEHEIAGSMIICLPELRTVKHEDVDEWATQTVPEICSFLDPDDLAHRVSGLFAQEAERRYKDIIVPLKEALKGAGT